MTDNFDKQNPLADVAAKVRNRQGMFFLGGAALVGALAVVLLVIGAARPVAGESAPAFSPTAERVAPVDLSARFIDKPIVEKGVFVFDSNDTFTQSLRYLGSNVEAVKKIVGKIDGECELDRIGAGAEMKYEIVEGKGVTSFDLPCAATKIAHVKYDGENVYSKFEEIPHFTREKVYVCEVQKFHSLIWSCAKVGVTEAQVMEVARALRSDVDFNNDVQGGDVFKILVNEVQDSEGKRLISGEVIAAEVILQGKEHWAIRYNGPEGKGFFDSRGASRVKTFLRSPLPFLRVSSGFTMKRFHPILGKVRPHLGVDFAAPPGTPVMASASGRVVKAGWAGGFGNEIEIQHGQLKTQYGHLSRIKVRNGQYVKQGQVIGAVGSTGLSTGPHLHYGMYKNGVAINPMSVKMDTTAIITSPAFRALRDHAVDMLKNAKAAKL